MKIAIDVSPLSTGHKVRGVGFYLENLKKSILEYDNQNEYVFFNQGEKIPNDIDIIHYPYFDPFFLTLPIYKKHKTIVTVHDLTPLVFPENFPSGIKGKIKWEIQKRALKNADEVITDSYCSKKDIIKHAQISPEKINVIYLAAGDEFRKVQGSSASRRIKVQSLRKKHNLPEQFALYVGDVTWNKNLVRLVEAVKKVNIPFVMVGKALADKNTNKKNLWNRDLIRIQEMIKEDNEIICLGFIQTEDLVSLYNMASVLVMPSLYEGFGLPALEAMKCGCPVILSTEGSLPEVGGDAAYYVDACNVGDISKGIKEVISDLSLQKTLSQQGLIQSRKFSWEKTAKETIKTYEKVLKGKNQV